MTESRERRPGDWASDLIRSKPDEDVVRRALMAEPRRIGGLVDHTRSYDKLDFEFWYRQHHVWLDVKMKGSAYSDEIAGLWKDVPREDLAIVDETVFRRIVWQGGGGYLAVHDHMSRRWVVMGPWDLVLGGGVRYQRVEMKTTGRKFLKGKVLVDLRLGEKSDEFSVAKVLNAVMSAKKWLKEVRAYNGEELPTVPRPAESPSASAGGGE